MYYERMIMYTVVETAVFKAQAETLWTNDERLSFFSYVAQNPLEGDVIPASGGLRKVRWKLTGSGKRGGVRVIYFNMLDDGLIVMLAMYAKNEKENMSSKELKQLKGDRHE
jgi:hypothetical protein